MQDLMVQSWGYLSDKVVNAGKNPPVVVVVIVLCLPDRQSLVIMGAVMLKIQLVTIP